LDSCAKPSVLELFQIYISEYFKPVNLIKPKSAQPMKIKKPPKGGTFSLEALGGAFQQIGFMIGHSLTESSICQVVALLLHPAIG
jgi:hypothetical protein